MNGETLQTELGETRILLIGLGFALVILAVAVHRIRRWYREDTGPADSSDEILERMADLHRQGQLSDEEFRSINSRFEGQLNNERN